MKSAGYVLLDHRLSGGAREEWDAEHCPHCQGLIYRARRGAGYAHFTLAEDFEWTSPTKFRVVRREVDAAWCTDCGAHVCDSKKCASACVPFMRKIDAYFRREALAEALGI